MCYRNSWAYRTTLCNHTPLSHPWPPTIRCIGSAVPSSLYSMQSLLHMLVSQHQYPAQEQNMTSKPAHPGVRQRAKLKTFSKRYDPYAARLLARTLTGTYDEQLGETNAALSAITQDSDNPPSQSMLRAIQRHRDVYQDYGREFRRTKVRTRPLYHHPLSLSSSATPQANVQAAVDQANLLSGVRNDIECVPSRCLSDNAGEL